MDSASIKATVDIVLDDKSFRMQQDRTYPYGSDNTTLEDIIIGSCSASMDLSCENIVNTIITSGSVDTSGIDPKSLDKKLPGGQSVGEALKDPCKNLEEEDLCDVINAITNTPLSLTYYLAYVTNISEDARIIDPQDTEGIGGGRIVLTPHKPESPSATGGKTDPLEKFCDPCFYHFIKNPLSYDLLSPEKEEFDKLESGKSMDIPFPWQDGGFGGPGDGGSSDLLDINGKPIITKEFYRENGVLKERNLKERSKVKIGKGGYEETELIAKYEGINRWLYTKYYGGTKYDLITLPKECSGLDKDNYEAEGYQGDIDKQMKAVDKISDIILSKDDKINTIDDLVKLINSKSDTPVSLDQDKLDDLGLDGESDLDFDFSSQPSVAQILDKSDLALNVGDDGKVKITSNEAAEDNLITGTYKVPPELHDGQVIQTNVTPEYWDTVGGPASLTPTNPSNKESPVVLTGPAKVHKKFKEFIKLMNKTGLKNPAGGTRYIGLSLGPAFTVTVNIKTKPREGKGGGITGLTSEYEYRFPIITISAAGGMKLSVEQPNLVYYKLTGGDQDLKNAIDQFKEDRIGGDKNYLDNLLDGWTFQDSDGNTFISQTLPGFKTGTEKPISGRPGITLEMDPVTGRPKSYKRKPKLKNNVELNCCPLLESKQYSITLVKPVGSTGTVDNPRLNVDQLQKAQAGAYDDTAVNIVSKMDKDILCCEDCFYCIASLCDNLGDTLKKIREAERNLRNQEPKNQRSPEEAQKGRPQCVVYDKNTGYPIPTTFLKRE